MFLFVCELFAVYVECGNAAELWKFIVICVTAAVTAVACTLILDILRLITLILTTICWSGSF